MSQPPFTDLLYLWIGGAWVDASSWLAPESRVITQGRATPYEDVSPAHFTFALWNRDGRWTPGTTLAGDFGAGTQVRYVVVRGASSWTRFWGTIATVDPDFPGGEVNSARAQVHAIDNQAFIETIRSESRWTTALAYYSSLASAAWHAWRIQGTGSAAATLAQINPASSARATIFTSTTQPTGGIGALSFSDAEGLAVDGSAQFKPSSSRWSSVIKLQVPAGSRGVALWIRFPGTTQTSATSSYRRVVQLMDASGYTLGHIRLTYASGVDNLSWCTPDGAAVSPPMAAGVSTSRWGLLTMRTHSYPQQTSFTWDGGAAAVMPMDLRNITQIAIGGATGMDCAEMEVAGICASSSAAGLPDSPDFGRADGASNLGGDLDNLSAFSPKYFTAPAGSDYGLATAMGDWSGRPLAEIARTVARTAGAGVLWARSRDSQLLVIPGSHCYPATPLVTIDTASDTIGAPRLRHAAADQPTRVLVSSPTGAELVIDTAAESAAGGQQRALDIETFARDGSAAREVGAAVLALAKPRATRVEQVEVDLTSSTHDLTPTLFSEASDLSGLYPTARVRLLVPSDHFGVSAIDGHVQGWTERYEADGSRGTVMLDLSPAALSRTTVVNPGPQSTAVGASVSLQLQATNSASLPVTWSIVGGMPYGLVLNVLSGLITGSLSSEGSWSPTVAATASDGSSTSVTWTWTAYATTPNSPGTPATAGNAASVLFWGG